MKCLVTANLHTCNLPGDHPHLGDDSRPNNLQCLDRQAHGRQRRRGLARVLQFTRFSPAVTTSSTARIKSFRTSISHPDRIRTRTSEADSPTMWQAIGTWHWRITTSKTTGFPIKREYERENLLASCAIMSFSLQSFGIDLTERRNTCNAAVIGNLSKSEQVLLDFPERGSHSASSAGHRAAKTSIL